VWHLQRWIAWGADLVIYSGGKGIRGPQDSGLLAGRKDLIAAAALNGNPNAAIGRGMKVSKEAMAGLWVALQWFMTHDHQRDFEARLSQAEFMQANLREHPDVQCELLADPALYPAPVLFLTPVEQRWNVRQVRQALRDGSPPVFCRIENGALEINTHCLLADEPEQVVDRLLAVLDGR
jgi:L-seryl-tRNA(Ser) seleniumtransferase